MASVEKLPRITLVEGSEREKDYVVDHVGVPEGANQRDQSKDSDGNGRSGEGDTHVM